MQCSCGDGYLICLVQTSEGKGIIYAKGNNNEYQCGIDKRINDNIQSLTKIEINDNLDFKYVCTYKGFSAAITSCGKLFVWGLKYKKDNKPLLIKTPILINKNEYNSIIIDEINFNQDYIYIIGRKLDNNYNYIKKLFLLEPNDEKIPFILKEINIEDNSRMIPIKVLIGINKTYCLCIDENKLIEGIIINDKRNGENNKNKIKILINESNQSYIEEKNLEKMKEIYLSDELNNFFELFKIFSDKNKKDLIKAFDDIKKREIKTNDIYYNELISYLKSNNELKDLLSFFLDNEKKEGKSLFNYLKIRIDLFEKNITNFIYINNSLKTEGLYNEIIEQNIIFLNDDFRVQYFYSLLLNSIDQNYYGLRYNKTKKQITIDRFKAMNFKEKYNEKKITDIHLSETIFGQLFSSLKNLEGKDFIREKGDRLFIVNLKGERASDAGGPYNEILSEICDDLQSDYIDLFINTPNNKYNIGELRDKYIINPNCDNINHKNAFEFIGKLMILSISSGETFNLNLHPIIWKSLLENEITFKDYQTIDYTFFNLIRLLKEGLSEKDEKKINSLDLNFIIKNSNEKDIELIENGHKIKVTLENVENYINLAQSKRLEEINNQINYIKKGLYSAIGKNILQILNWKQLEEMICGEPLFDIKDFMKHTEYINCDIKDKIIQWFWEWLENCKEKDKFKYLKFVSGRSRLPKSDYKHKINVFNEKDKLPVSHTCFSKLDLPRYDSKDIFHEKIKYVIDNVTSITDY